MTQGRYVVIEGNDGSGKTTQLERLRQRLLKMDLPVVTFREPAGDAVGRAIRRLLADPQFEIDARTEVLLFNAARSGLMLKIQSTLARGIWCIADRSFLSTLAYQCYGRQDGLDISAVQKVCDFAIDACRPDQIVVLDAPAEELRKRRESLAMGDRIDQMDLSFFERVGAGYVAEAKRLDLPLINALESPEAVEAAIWEYVEPLIKGVK